MIVGSFSDHGAKFLLLCPRCYIFHWYNFDVVVRNKAMATRDLENIEAELKSVNESAFGA
jgi:ABC-type microcin C transport system permease subunit YejE